LTQRTQRKGGEKGLLWAFKIWCELFETPSLALPHAWLTGGQFWVRRFEKKGFRVRFKHIHQDSENPTMNPK
jgi:hypothetical protein